MDNANSGDVINFKLLIIGDSGVGKSSLLMRYISDSFDNRVSATIGVDFRIKITTVPDGSTVKLSIWDTAGQERFRTLTPNFYRGAHGALIVYDVSNRESFDRLTNWMEELKTFSNHADMVQMLVGNKIDQKPRQVTREEGIRFARLYNMPYSEASAKTSEGVNSLFFDLVTRIYAKPSLWDPQNRRHTNRTNSSSRLQLNQSKRSPSDCC
ncbi:Member Ras oncogene family RAB18A [Fasciolopsis buskii]|uniref:Member Ras oncogene family RAB18A n=1 Tax=Fasciolopsis buskii TaxID=27845 RepID=A0A8E0VFV9_9TREM|nr:Member Ras oncogene family RAB18A [Fasciolopsis buski]